uniref:Fibulin-5-like n=1 Tax=Cyprinus carpio TaxID=7962 RepID=A0A8C1J4W2_CYPCA
MQSINSEYGLPYLANVTTFTFTFHCCTSLTEKLTLTYDSNIKLLQHNYLHIMNSINCCLFIYWTDYKLRVSLQTCTEGFTYEHRARQCIDIDECRTLPDPCRGDMRCVNQNGGYLCIPRPGPSYPIVSRSTPCILGYTLGADGTCVDVDECETQSHQCNPTQVCINTAGGYTCSCTEGYWLVGGQCQDIDECRYGYCQQLCANVPGSYSCSCSPGFLLNADSRTCQDVDECATNPCSHGCLNTYGSFMCTCDEGFELAADGTTCNDLDECSFSDFLCQYTCVNTPGSFSCVCPPGYYVYEDGRSCEDLNECESGNNTCTTAQVCFNFQGGYTCLNPLRCDPPYIELNDNQCMCSAENPACRERPFTVLYRHMDLSSGRSVPADIFQMQATTRYPGAFYIFQIKSGNEGREFYMRQTSNISATLVLARPIRGPKTIVLDLEMVTVNNVINFRGSSVIRLTIFVSEHPF